MFKNLIVLDLANNHYGDVDHAKKTIDAFAEVLKPHFGGWHCFIKLQYRHLPFFIHQAHREDKEPKYIQRFMQTKLTYAELMNIGTYAQGKGFDWMVTPFDEHSAGMLHSHPVSMVKIASASANDFSLLDSVAELGKPVIVSVGGLNIREVDNVVSFLSHRGVTFALNHCVSIYPCPPEHMDLDQIRILKERYPQLTIGWSTHEHPDDNYTVAVAYGKGARLFERHIGLPYKRQPLNAYSSSPAQIVAWLDTLIHAHEVAPDDSLDPASLHELSLRHTTLTEAETLSSLKRGVYARCALGANQYDKDETPFYFAMPCAADQIRSDQLTETFVLLRDKKKDDPIRLKDIKFIEKPTQPIKDVIHSIKAMLAYARIKLPPSFDTEYSHHYGIKQFRQIGTTMITVFNRYYAKKLLFMAPGQKHPEHYHKLKEESFLILWGTLVCKVDGREYELGAGETITVMPGSWHSFQSEYGCIFEEISTTAIPKDSVYRDPRINALSEAERKSKVKGWGRYELEEKF